MAESAFRAALGLPSSPARAFAGGPEVRYWRLRAGLPDEALPTHSTEGPLLPSGLYHAVEAWVDSELSALHALWWVGRRCPDILARVNEAKGWHLLHTQPDNATNRPWAIHVFALDPHPESQLYAQTLLHNALAASMRPGALAALLMLDAADAIESAMAR